MVGGSWKRTGRVNYGSGPKAKPVYLCAVCLCWHDRIDLKTGKLVRPLECMFCGRTEFDRFDSSGEAQAWALLHRRQKAGEVRALRRQVPFDLLTVGRQGLACKWAEIVLDFAFEEKQGGEWVSVYCDFKPAQGMSPDSALKIRCLEAMGYPVRIVTSKGEV